MHAHPVEPFYCFFHKLETLIADKTWIPGDTNGFILLTSPFYMENVPHLQPGKGCNLPSCLCEREV